jgi:pyruvate/2-oxoglutarate dehydrogenase complex dihydrolipoamide dehydrogenase (E3) component
MPAMRQVDLCVIGSGPGGQKAAIQAAKLGKRVCIVERRERIGGVAVHTGTIPSKALREMILRVGGIRRAVPRLQEFLAAGRAATLKQLWAYYDKVIQGDPKRAGAYYDRGRAYEGIGDIEQLVRVATSVGLKVFSHDGSRKPALNSTSDSNNFSFEPK